MIFFLFVKNITYYVLSTHISLYMYKNTFFALIFGFHYSHTASEVVGKRNVDLLGLSIFFFQAWNTSGNLQWARLIRNGPRREENSLRIAAELEDCQT